MEEALNDCKARVPVLLIALVIHEYASALVRATAPETASAFVQPDVGAAGSIRAAFAGIVKVTTSVPAKTEAANLRPLTSFSFLNLPQKYF